MISLGLYVVTLSCADLKIDLDTTLAQAEVLFLTFRELVAKTDAEPSEGSESSISEELRSLLQGWKADEEF